ncbi:lipoyl(octanoyl) transferase LipB [Leucobacter sp. M11]|uniref:lipoyl(octanoyl) transferase LipB n=1 Tax=Leucobacter sp. M11 TaxID=2993565 RepID=UPI002D80293F|nr:lipoyl(octanoyl) transferase LipB [Leucobacter sp. M11]MEB4616395.1 lipoyl(octanoyl) transferase LipB [Leucobacter sp. M11]
MVTILTPGYAPDFLEYPEGWALQRSVHAGVVAGSRPDTLILCEHRPVYTAGTRTRPEHRPGGSTPVVDVDRGGSITWHGPGQLIGYPIVRLPEPRQVVAFVRLLEGAIIAALADFGITGERIAGRSGVWVGADGRHNKIAAIGLRVASGVTMHGFAINCSNELEPYAHITACGIEDAGITTLSVEAERTITPAEFAPAVRDLLSTALVAAGIGVLRDLSPRPGPVPELTPSRTKPIARHPQHDRTPS